MGASAGASQGGRGQSKTEPELSQDQASREKHQDELGLSCGKSSICKPSVPYPPNCACLLSCLSLSVIFYSLYIVRNARMDFGCAFDEIIKGSEMHHHRKHGNNTKNSQTLPVVSKALAALRLLLMHGPEEGAECFHLEPDTNDFMETGMRTGELQFWCQLAGICSSLLDIIIKLLIIATWNPI